MGKIKILFVADHIGKGGAEKQLLNLLNNIDRDKFEPSLFITEKSGARFSELRDDIKVYGLVGSNKRQSLKALRMLRKVIVELRPHIIQTWLEYSTFVSALALLTISRKPVLLASQRGSIEELYTYFVRFGEIKKKILAWAYRQSRKVIINSKFIVDQLLGYGAREVTVIYNGIDLEYFRKLPSREDLRKELGLGSNVYYVVFAGALVESKGISYLIDAVKDTINLNICLLIIGDGPLLQKASALTEGDQRFKIMGYKSNAVEYIKAADLLVLPSLHEGLPNVILEAMAVGTPVIATDIHGIPELIENGINGLLVSPGDTDSLKTAMKQIIDNPRAAKRYVETSMRKVDFFNIQRMVSEYEMLYLESSANGNK